MCIALKRTLVIGLCTGFLYTTYPVPRAKAMDPATIAILAPIVLPYAKAAAAYAIKGTVRSAPGLLNAGMEVLNILRLPLGVLQVFLGWPFGLMGTGFHNIVRGFAAPFLFIKEILSMPLYFFGFSKP
ncbi:MAG: hypothetical protein K9M56_01055 [Victivallales bacterium]|nr:hypothetical protein [Victivallales bacterium]